MNYFIQIKSPNKAKNDIDVLFHEMGYTNLTPHNERGGAIGRFFFRLAAVGRILTTLHKGDTLCLQYPMKKFYTLACKLAHVKKARVVTIVHDLGAFRRHKLTVEQENRRLSNTDFLIVHNQKMQDHLIAHGFKHPIFCLDIFDFLTASQPSPFAAPRSPLPASPIHVVYAGNLARWRNEFLYHLDEEMGQWTLDVYGKGFDDASNHNPNLHYHGSLPPDDFVAQVNADFGLVWDGSSLDECDGEWGRYLLINNPHKTSFYLRAGIPVIVWAEAAMAPFVLKEGIGIAIHSIRELKEILPAMTSETYARLKMNAMKFSEKLGSGYYTRRAFEAANNKGEK